MRAVPAELVAAAAAASIEGLAELMEEFKPQLAKAAAWCDDAGATSVADIKGEYVEQFIEALGLKTMQKQRLREKLEKMQLHASIWSPTPSGSEVAAAPVTVTDVVADAKWEAALEALKANGEEAFHECVKRMQKMFSNVVNEPTNEKFRKINLANANFKSKVYSCGGAPALFALLGFSTEIKDGFLVLPADAALAPLQRAVNELRV